MKKETYKVQNKRKKGSFYEDLAADYLLKKGYTIREKNFRCRYGEIDIIAEKSGTIVFVEVKYRRGEGSGLPEEAVNASKQKTISFVALFYLKSHVRVMDVPVRFDVIGINGGNTINHVENAFDFCY